MVLAEDAVDECREIYERTCGSASGCPCMCEEDTNNEMEICGDTSAEIRSGGAEPICSDSDHRIEDDQIPRQTLLKACSQSY